MNVAASLCNKNGNHHSIKIECMVALNANAPLWNKNGNLHSIKKTQAVNIHALLWNKMVTTISHTYI